MGLSGQSLAFPTPGVRVSRVLKLCVLLFVGWILLSGFGLPSISFSRLYESLRADNQVNGDGMRSTASQHTQQAPTPTSRIERPRLGYHHYRADGLVVVNPGGAHPIFELMAKAEEAWNAKIHRASSSLGEAVREYRRRYHRSPPKGFDLWWEYVKQHDVQLPDEYDQIYLDLEPFWGLEPKDLLKTRRDLESQPNTFVIGKMGIGKLDVLATTFMHGNPTQHMKTAEQLRDLLSDIEELLPPFRAIVSTQDGPGKLSDFAIKSAAVRAASLKQYIPQGSLPKATGPSWRSACSPTSPASLIDYNLDKPPPVTAEGEKTFIYDHVLSMDPCLHPELLWQHGQFVSHNTGPMPQRTMIPLFTQCSTAIHHDIRFPTPYGWIDDLLKGDNPDWDDRLDERLHWRGSNTGIYHAEHIRWRQSHRIHAVQFTNDLNGTVDLLNAAVQEYEPVGKPITVQKAHLNPAVMDVKFAGEPIACKPEVCKIIETMVPWTKYQPVKLHGNYKYVLDIDGNAWSGRFKRLITSNALVFKATIYPEWFADRIQPWLHYVPVKLDLSDLHDSLVFFRGNPGGDGGHEDLAKKIAAKGRQWSREFWRKEDLVAYFFRLILEYARLMSLDREATSYTKDDDD